MGGRLTLLLFGLSFLFVSCVSGARNEETVLLVSVDKGFEVDSVGYSLPNVTACCVWEDSLLLVKHKRDSSRRALSIYNMNSHIVERSVDYGNGDNCVLSLSFSPSPHGVLLYDIVKRQMSLMTPEAFTGDETISFQQTDIFTQVAVAGTNHRVLYLNPASLEGKKRLLLSDENFKAASVKKEPCDNFNVVNGFILLKPDGACTCFVDKHSGDIEFYDEELRLFKKIHLASALVPEYYIHKTRNGAMRSFLNSVPFSFVAYSFNSNAIALLFDPFYLLPDDKYVYMEPHASALLLSWDGEIVESVLLPDARHPKGCHISSDGKLEIFYFDETEVRKVVVKMGA